MRVLHGRAERRVDAFLECLGEGMLEPVGLSVDGIELELERLGQVELDQTVVAKHLEGDALTAPREPDAPVELMVGEL
jgi:hypothetical protein